MVDFNWRCWWALFLTKGSQYFLTNHRTASDISFIPFDLNHCNRDSLLKAREDILLVKTTIRDLKVLKTEEKWCFFLLYPYTMSAFSVIVFLPMPQHYAIHSFFALLENITVVSYNCKLFKLFSSRL